MKLRKTLSENYLLKIIITCVIFLTFLFLLYKAFYFLYPGEEVQIYGDKSFENSKIYINNNYEGDLVWDESENRTFARDNTSLGRHNLINKKDEFNTHPDNMKARERSGRIDIKIVKPNGEVYLMHFGDAEDLSYFIYDTKDFKRIK